MQACTRARWLFLLFGLFAAHAPSLSRAAGKGSTVAVMPFRDLSGGGKFIGEAIRETVTSDLKQLGSLRVVERGSLDKILAEQDLQVHTKDLDMSAAVKLGKVLGASLIVIGAYQKLPPQVRLTARFVKVETSEIIGTAKVDGSVREFLRLQDSITAALLRSAGFAVHAKRVLDASVKRPDLKSMNTLELYGQALTADNDNVKRQYLSAAVAEDQDFSYAAKDLEALEKRMEQYQAAAQKLQLEELRVLDEKLREATEPGPMTQLTYKKMALLIAMKRYHTVVRTARGFFEKLPAGAKVDNYVDGIASLMLSAYTALRDREGLLRDGEQFLARAPGSAMFQGIKRMMEHAIAEKRRIEEGAKKVEEMLAGLSSLERWDLCRVALVYDRAQQYESARRLYEACFAVGSQKRADSFEPLLMIDYNLGDWKSLRKRIAEWAELDAKKAAVWRRSYEQSIPSDD